MAERGTDTGTEQQTGAEQEATGAATAAEETATSGEAGTEGLEETEGTDDSSITGELGKVKTEPGVQKKIDKEVGRRKRAEEDAAYWKGRAEGLEAAGKASKNESGKSASAGNDEAAIRTEFARQNPKPKESDFKAEGRSAEDAWELSQEALMNWVLDQREFVKERKTSAGTRDREAGQLQETIATQREKGEQEFKDFPEVVRNLELPNPMLEAVYLSPEGHKLAYYLGQNPKEAARIAALSPILQVKEMGKLESKIEAGTIQLKKPVSKAPEPAPKPGAKGAIPDADEKKYTDPNTSTAERIRISQERKRREAQGK